VKYRIKDILIYCQLSSSDKMFKCRTEDDLRCTYLFYCTVVFFSFVPKVGMKSEVQVPALRYCGHSVGGDSE
jgi:hypothetical protein